MAPSFYIPNINQNQRKRKGAGEGGKRREGTAVVDMPYKNGLPEWGDTCVS